jgi:hypothetical protein
VAQPPAKKKIPPSLATSDPTACSRWDKYLREMNWNVHILDFISSTTNKNKYYILR